MLHGGRAQRDGVRDALPHPVRSRSMGVRKKMLAHYDELDKQGRVQLDGVYDI